MIELGTKARQETRLEGQPCQGAQASRAVADIEHFQTKSVWHGLVKSGTWP